MRGPFFVNDSLLLFGELDTKPSHGVHPCAAKRAESTSMPSDIYIYRNRPDWESLIQFRPEYNRVETLFDQVFGNDGGFLSQAWPNLPLAIWVDDTHLYIEADMPG